MKSKFQTMKERLIRLLEDNRGLVIVLFCLPASFIFDLIFKFWTWLQRKWESGRTHEDKVQRIQQAVQEWNRLPPYQRKFMVTARPTWLSLSTTFFPKVRSTLLV